MLTLGCSGADTLTGKTSANVLAGNDGNDALKDGAAGEADQGNDDADGLPRRGGKAKSVVRTITIRSPKPKRMDVGEKGASKDAARHGRVERTVPARERYAAGSRCCKVSSRTEALDSAPRSTIQSR